MRIWLVSFSLLFGIVEGYQWLRTLTVPFPVYVICGIALAIASNLEKGTVSEIPSPQNPTIAQPLPTLDADGKSAVQLPPSSISYKVDQPAWKHKNL